jgi:hypothetical protein
MDDKHLTEIEEAFKSNLLSTIRIPKNLHFLTERLPKANYTPVKIKKVEKHHFLSTLAGYKDTSHNSSMIEDAVRGSESVDKPTYRDRGDKNDRIIRGERPERGDRSDPKVYLPPLSKDTHDSDIMKIYGTKDRKPKPNLIEAERAIINIEADLNPIKKNPEPRKPKLRERSEREKELLKELKEREREREHNRSIEKESEYDRHEIGSYHRHQGSIGGGKDPIYKVHDLNKDAERHMVNIKHIYGGGKPKELSPIKDPLHAIIKRNKYVPVDSSETQE